MFVKKSNHNISSQDGNMVILNKILLVQKYLRQNCSALYTYKNRPFFLL